MYQREFEQTLRSELPRAVLLYGENGYAVDRYAQHYKDRLDAAESMLSLYYDEYDYDRAREYLSQSSLFGGVNLLILRRDKKVPKKELDTLVELCRNREGNYLLILFDGDARDAKAMQSSFTPKKGGVWVRLFPPKQHEALQTLQQMAREIGVEIDSYALAHLHALLGGDLELCRSELSKLAILDRPVTSGDIDALVYSTAPLAAEELLIGLFEKRPVTETLTRLLELGEDEFALLRTTQYFVQQIFLFHAYIRLHGQPNSQEILGYKLPRHIEEQKARLALRIKPAALLRITEHLLESELRLKKSAPETREALLYGTLIRLQGYL